MPDPRDTRPHDFDTTAMGPGFFVFFNYGIIESGGYFFDFERLRPKANFRAKTEEEKEAKPILEDIAKRIEPDYDSRDLEIILRLRLRQQHIIYKNLYLKWLETQKKALKKKIKREIVKKRQDEEEILLLYLLTE